MKSIILKPHEVRGILEGRQTQIRRVVKPQPSSIAVITKRGHPENQWLLEKWPKAERDFSNFGRCENIVCPYGQPGDRLWVRETWCQPVVLGDLRNAALKGKHECIEYAADMGKERFPLSGNFTPHLSDFRWRPSIHMPRIFSRITLEFTAVRVERVQDISEEDAKAEGCFLTDYGRQCFHQGQGNPDTCPADQKYHPHRDGWMWHETTRSGECLVTARGAFANLCNNIHGPEFWNENPWVWVYGVRKV